MITQKNRRSGNQGTSYIGRYGVSYLSRGHQIVYPGSNPIEMSDYEEGVFRKSFLGFRTLYIFDKVCRKPISLVMDPLKGCQLQCKYCYSKSSNRDKLRVSPEKLEELQKKYNFEAVSFFGGDPFYDLKYSHECLNALGKVKSLIISTNGLGVTESRIKEFEKFCSKFTLQFSIEPKDWDQRVNSEGKHQSDIIFNRIRDLPKERNIHLGLAIPRYGLKTWLSYPEIIDFFNKVIGERTWTSNWKFEESTDDFPPDYEVSQLPKWFDEWLKHEYNLIGPNYTREICNKGILGTHVGRLSLLSLEEAYPFSFTACQGGMGSIGLGPNGNISICHHKTEDDDNDYLIKKETPREVWKLLSKIPGKLNSKVCDNCISRYVCGGICFSNGNNETCEASRSCFTASLEALFLLKPEVYKIVSDKTTSSLIKFKDNFSHYEHLVSTDIWKNLISGEIDIEDLASLYEDTFGIKPLLDTELFNLPRPSGIIGNSYI